MFSSIFFSDSSFSLLFSSSFSNSSSEYSAFSSFKLLFSYFLEFSYFSIRFFLSDNNSNLFSSSLAFNSTELPLSLTFSSLNLGTSLRIVLDFCRGISKALLKGDISLIPNLSGESSEYSKFSLSIIENFLIFPEDPSEDPLLE